MQQFGGIDILINTAALFPSSPDGVISDAQWALTLEVNVTANYLLADEAAKIFSGAGHRREHGADELGECGGGEARERGVRREQGGAEPPGARACGDVLAPRVRVNGISPATVVKGSTMFPRDRVIASLKKYNLPFEEADDATTSCAMCWRSSMRSGR